MKLGSNNRKVVIGVSALFALALLMFARMILMSAGSTSAAPPLASTATSPAAANKSAAAAQRRGHLKTSDKKNAKTAGPPTPSLDPRLKLEQLELAENTEYAGTGRNIFQDQAEPVIPHTDRTGPSSRSPRRPNTRPAAHSASAADQSSLFRIRE